MRNPNGPSIEEKEQMAEYLRERNDDYNSGWNAALSALNKRLQEVINDWRLAGSIPKVNAAEYIQTLLDKQRK